MEALQAQLREAREAKARADQVARKYICAFVRVCRSCAACLVAHIRWHACPRMQEIEELKSMLNKSSEELRNLQLELARIKGSPEKKPSRSDSYFP